MRLAVFVIILSLLSGDALAQSCETQVGAEMAAVYVERCIEVSPATRPPCNAANPCELILKEVERGCAILVRDGWDTIPDYCAESHYGD